MLDKDKITIIITTSPIPSNPSTKLIQSVLESLKLSPALSNCPIILVFDGYVVNKTPKMSQFKSSHISVKESIAYEEYRTAVHQLFLNEATNNISWSTSTTTADKCNIMSTSSYSKRVGGNVSSTITQRIYNPTLQTLTQSVRVGFALAVHSALDHVNTPYVLILQHDWAFTYPIPIDKLLKTMDEDHSINYIGFISRTVLEYMRITKHIAKSVATEIIIKNDEPFLRLMFWYDKPHLGRTSYYKTQVFGQQRFKRGDFIEDTFGQTVLGDIKAMGLAGWSKYGCWLWYPDNGRTLTVRHLNGRAYMDEPGYWMSSDNGPFYSRRTMEEQQPLSLS